MLGYTVTKALTIPPEAFDENGIATLVVNGPVAVGEWALAAGSTHEPPGGALTVLGSIVTEPAPGRPDLAAEAAQDWIEKECERLGLSLIHVENLHPHYGPAETAAFAALVFTIARW